MLRMDQQLGRPVLIEFWDFCRPNSIRTLPYLKAWHERYEPAGLRVIGVHASGFPPSGDPDAVRAAVERLGIAYPVVVDVELEIWEQYGNLGWPARYLFDQRGMLFELPLRRGGLRRDRAGDPGAARDRAAGARRRCGPRTFRARCSSLKPRTWRAHTAGRTRRAAVWAVLDGEGWVEVDGRRVAVTHPGAYELISHPQSTEGVLELEVGRGRVLRASASRQVWRLRRSRCRRSSRLISSRRPVVGEPRSEAGRGRGSGGESARSTSARGPSCRC